MDRNSAGFGDAYCLLLWTVGQQHDKFVSADPARGVGGSDQRLQGVCGRDQKLVTGCVTVLIVDYLEVVQIGVDQRVMSPAPLGPKSDLVEAPFELAWIRQADQRIMRCVIGEFSILDTQLPAFAKRKAVVVGYLDDTGHRDQDRQAQQAVDPDVVHRQPHHQRRQRRNREQPSGAPHRRVQCHDRGA